MTDELLNEKLEWEFEIEARGHHCESCGDHFSYDNLTLIEDTSYLCADCVSDYCVKCNSCKQMVFKQNTILDESGIICDWCLKEKEAV